jgi:ABC-type transporter Mla subunit MlaD
MTKQTRRNKKNKNKNKKTNKYFGGDSNEFEKSKGIFDIIGDKLSTYSGEAAKYAEDKGLRLLGLQPIENNANSDNPSTNNIDSKIGEISDAASGVVSGIKSVGSDVVNIFDKGSAALVGQINDVLESPKVGQSLSGALEETAEIGTKLLQNFNETIGNNPELKQQVELALDNASDYAEIAVDAMDEPINKAIDSLNEAGTKAAAGAVSGIVKVGTDALAAVPGAGAVIEVGKMANDASAAVGDVVEAASQAASTLSKVVEETSKNLEEGINKLEERKKEGMQIVNRADKSLDNFENPLKTNVISQIQSGGNKTRRKFLKRKSKSKRVRFAI